MGPLKLLRHLEVILSFFFTEKIKQNYVLVPLFMEFFHLVLGARYQLIAISINLFSFFYSFFSVSRILYFFMYTLTICNEFNKV